MRATREIDALLAELLNSGVSPKYISRLAAELEEHQADLEAEARRLGVPEDEAAEDARLRLGDCSEIAKEFALRPELRSWVYESRWLERILRVLGAGYLLMRSPARMVAAGQAVMLRYTAATAAGASVTVAILLMLTALMPPNSTWGVRLVESAGAALGAWELDRPEPRRRRIRSAAETVPPSAPSSPTAEERTESPEAEARLPEPRVPAVRLRAPVLTPTKLDLADPVIFPTYDRSQARAVLAELEPSVHLGIEDREFKPILKESPEYPLAAARRGLEGHVVVEYTVTRAGTVTDVVVVESTHPVFNRAALEAAQGFTYEPRVIRGQPVDVHGVRIVIRFELEA